METHGISFKQESTCSLRCRAFIEREPQATCRELKTSHEEAQAGIKIAGRNIDNLRYADDTTLMAESEEALKSLLMKVKEESEKGSHLMFSQSKTSSRWMETDWHAASQDFLIDCKQKKLNHRIKK